MKIYTLQVAGYLETFTSIADALTWCMEVTAVEEGI